MVMIGVDLEQIRDLWKINTDKEPHYTKLAQNRRVAAAEAGVTFPRFIIIRDVTKRCTPQVLICFEGEFTESWHSKQILGGTCTCVSSNWFHPQSQ